MAIEEKLLFYNPRTDEENDLIRKFLRGDRDLNLIYDLIRVLSKENVVQDESVVEGQKSGGFHWSQKHLALVDSVSGPVYLIGEQEDEISLTEDPSKTDFDSFYDTGADFREGDSSDKGRAVPVIDISDFPDLVLGDERKVIGVDPARFGDDRTIIAVRHGIHIIDIQSFAKQDTVVTTGKVLDAIKEHRPSEVVVDGTGGLGAGIVDQLKKEGVESECILTEVTFNENPRDEKYNAYNVRAEMYLMLQEKFRKGEITVPPHKEMAEQLASIKYEYSGDSEKIRISAKSKIKKRMGVSPDIADALALCFYSKNQLFIY